jgi:hypothetical protein
VYLLGIDCNYVEILDEAEKGQGTELTIVKTPKDNPNYFFDDYQQPGDQYNIPNPNRDVHLESWREIAERLLGSHCRVLNPNLLSKVDAIDFCDIDALLSGGRSVQLRRERMFLYNFILNNGLASAAGQARLLVVDSDSLFPRQLFEEYDTPVDMIDGPISPECLEGVSFLHLGRQGAAGDALQTLAGLKQPPEVVEIRCAEASSGGEWRGCGSPAPGTNARLCPGLGASAVPANDRATRRTAARCRARVR